MPRVASAHARVTRRGCASRRASRKQRRPGDKKNGEQRAENVFHIGENDSRPGPRAGSKKRRAGRHLRLKTAAASAESVRAHAGTDAGSESIRCGGWRNRGRRVRRRTARGSSHHSSAGVRACAGSQELRRAEPEAQGNNDDAKTQNGSHGDIGFEFTVFSPFPRAGHPTRSGAEVRRGGRRLKRIANADQ